MTEQKTIKGMDVYGADLLFDPAHIPNETTSDQLSVSYTEYDSPQESTESEEYVVMSIRDWASL